MNTGLKPVWAGRNMRLDPFRLPQAVSYATRDDAGDVTVTIDHRGAVIRRTLERSGLPAVIALPAHVFRGVAARAIEDGAGAVTVTLELLHDDPALSVPLLVADDLDDIAAAFVPHDQGQPLHRSGRPFVPLVDVEVRPAYGSRANLYENVLRTGDRDGDFPEIGSMRPFRFDESFHRLHGGRPVSCRA